MSALDNDSPELVAAMLQIFIDREDHELIKAYVSSYPYLKEVDSSVLADALKCLSTKRARGRPLKNKPRTKARKIALGLACKIKAELLKRAGKSTLTSFKAVWEFYSSEKTRPTVPKQELWKCAGELLIVKDYEGRQAMEIFKLTEDEAREIYRERP